MTDHPRLSIGVPVYNGMPYLPRCLDNAAAMAGPDDEIIISDNGCNDGSSDVIDGFAQKDGRVRVVRLTETVSMIDNFQTVLEAASGIYFCWRACDDLSGDDYADRLIAVLEAHPEKQMAAGSVVQVNETGEEGVRLAPADDPKLQNWFQARAWRSHNIAYSWFYAVYRREPLVQEFTDIMNRYDLVWGIDPVLLWRFVLQDGIATDPEAVFYQLVKPESANRYQPKSGLDYFRQFRAIYKTSAAAIKEGGFLDRIKLRLLLVGYAHRHGGRLDRAVQRTLFAPYYWVRDRQAGAG